ncbi:MAG: hypothetical protein HY343_08910 [Lentisphaerae bacterium]|nr:hypothetical protein [Lentisphaerota bacterium]
MKTCAWLILAVGLPLAMGIGQQPAPAQSLPASAAASDDPRSLLRALSEDYYDLERAGLARSSCLFQSHEILDSFDKTVRTILGRTHFEAIVVPGKPVTVRAQDIPPEYGADARGGIAAYALLAQGVLNAIFGALNAVPSVLDPDKLERNATVSLRTTAGNAPQRQLVIESRDRVGLDGKPVGRDAGAGAARSRVSVELTLNRDGRIQTINKTTPQGREQTAVVSDKIDRKYWILKSLDIAKYDTLDRLVERSQITLTYTVQKGLQLPSKITFRVLDKEGHLVHRRGEPNPVSIQFTGYSVELRR